MRARGEVEAGVGGPNYRMPNVTQTPGPAKSGGVCRDGAWGWDQVEGRGGAYSGSCGVRVEAGPGPAWAAYRPHAHTTRPGTRAWGTRAPIKGAEQAIMNLCRDFPWGPPGPVPDPRHVLEGTHSGSLGPSPTGGGSQGGRGWRGSRPLRGALLCRLPARRAALGTGPGAEVAARLPAWVATFSRLGFLPLFTAPHCGVTGRPSHESSATSPSPISVRDWEMSTSDN